MIEAINDWVRENAAFIAIFLLFFCAFILDRIYRVVHDINRRIRRRDGIDD